MLITLLFIAVLFLSYWNGANDNFKGVATLYGSRTVSYKTAIGIATVATFLGSISAIFLAQGLIASFSGKGLVPLDTASSISFLMAVGFGAAFTVLLATRLGFPISTTHSLVGALLGAGLMAVGWEVNLQRLGGVFFIPLLVSPLIAFALGGSLYWFFTRARHKMGLNKESCFCVGKKRELIPVGDNLAANITAVPGDANYNPTLSLALANDQECMDMYTDRVRGVYLQKVLDVAHIISAATVSFARGLNDTPKIAGLLVAAQAVDIQWSMLLIATVMAVGGLLNARRVAETISHKITDLNHGQGFAANFATGVLVIFASKLGVPVSTTHVSVGSIFGIGLVSGKRDSKVIVAILLSWLVTLPVAIVFSAMAYWILV